MTTATSRTTPCKESIHILPWNVATKYVMTALNSKGRHEKIAIAVQILQNTYDFVISHRFFTEDGKETYKDSKRMCRTNALLIIYTDSIKWMNPDFFIWLKMKDCYKIEEVDINRWTYSINFLNIRTQWRIYNSHLHPRKKNENNLN